MSLPSVLAGKKVLIETDVVKCDIPLLLSKEAMKKASMQIDFKNDTVIIFGERNKLLLTSTGHYCVPISKQPDNSQIQDSFIFHTDASCDQNEKLRKAKKLHSQFSHPTKTKLSKLLQDAGIQDKDLINAIEVVTEQCDTCLKYRKAPPRPIVGLSMAHQFNEVVGMDLKEWKNDEGKKVRFLHLVDHATRYSASSLIKSKKKEVIVEELFKIWIKIFGYPEKFLADNGGEFNN